MFTIRLRQGRAVAGALSIAALCAVGLVGGCATSRPPTVPPIRHGRIATTPGSVVAPKVDFSGTTLTGRHLSLDAFRGHVVFVAAWASWCSSCMEEMPTLARVAKEVPNARFLGIDVSDDKSSALAAVEADHVPFPSLFDPTRSIVRSIPGLFNGGLPTDMYVTRSGRMYLAGGETINEQQLVNYLRDLASAE